MRVFSGIGQVPKDFGPSVAALGVFDGVHKGHQKLIASAVRDARRLGVKSIVVTFHPHPAQVLGLCGSRAYISTLDERLWQISQLGPDACLVLRFTNSFSHIAPDAFVTRYLVARLGVRKVIVGADFHFGFGRKGSVEDLSRLGAAHGFEVRAMPLLTVNGLAVKSQIIRDMVKQGDFVRVSRLLGRNFSITGKVVSGDGRGRELGFPTANLRPQPAVPPAEGIYVARVFLNGKRQNALLYAGRRQTFKSVTSPFVFEVYILDFSGRLYGKTIKVEVLKRIRGDQKFFSKEGLIKQMRQDELFARRFFSRLSF